MVDRLNTDQVTGIPGNTINVFESIVVNNYFVQKFLDKTKKEFLEPFLVYVEEEDEKKDLLERLMNKHNNSVITAHKL